jgi:hypothetical protein
MKLLHPWLAGRMKIEKMRVIFLTFFIILLVLITPLGYCFLNQKAYADGLSVVNSPPASVGNRQLSLYVKVNPPILTAATAHNAYMQFRLFNAANN